MFTFMGKSILDKHENEDKHSCCVSFLETEPYEKKYKTWFKKIPVV